MDFENYLVNELYTIAKELGFDNKINVAEWRSFKMPENKEDLLFVVRYITGSYIGSIKTQPVQIFAYSELNDIQSVYMILDGFAKKHNNYQTIIDNNFIKMNFETPVSMRNFIQSETGYRASVYVYGNYVECENIIDYKALKLKISDSNIIDIPYLSLSIGYVGVLNTTKITGEQLSYSMKQEAGLTISINLMNTDDDFCNLIHDIMFGNKDGNYEFNFILVKQDDSEDNVVLKLETVTLPTNKTSAPTLQLNFRR